jgi:hypothetical protein
MDEGATAAEALIRIPQAISDARAAATDIATKIDDKIYSRHPTSCGNERWMKNAGFFKSCVKRGKEVCPTCRLVEVSAAEAFVRGEPRSERGVVVAGEVFAAYRVARCVQGHCRVRSRHHHKSVIGLNSVRSM